MGLNLITLGKAWTSPSCWLSLHQSAWPPGHQHCDRYRKPSSGAFWRCQRYAASITWCVCLEKYYP